MKQIINIAVVGLGNVGSYLLNELNKKKKEIENKVGKKINVVAISAKNINKKRKFKINKKIFYKNPLKIIRKKKIDILFELIGQSDGVSKKIESTAKFELFNGFSATGSFNINLSDYDIERPTLMLIKIDDEIKIEYFITNN